MASRKEFVLNVTQDLVASPRAVLAGHGIPSMLLGEIAKRPDIISKLAVFLYSTKFAKKGAKGLKKAKGQLLIKAYKNFPTFNAKGREDVETFMAEMDEKDLETFSNSDSILTIVALPDKVVSDDSDNPENLEANIVAGKSIAMGFDKAVTKEYKIPGCFYITVMFADSIIRPAEEKAAARTEKKNARVQNKRTPAKIKKELKDKAKKAQLKIDREIAKLEQQKFAIETENQQLINLGRQQFGVKSNNRSHVMGAITKANAAASGSKAEFDAAIAALHPAALEDVKLAMKLVKRGKKGPAKSLLKGINSPDIAIIANGVLNPESFTTGDDRVKARRKKIVQRNKELNVRNEELLAMLEVETDAKKRRSIQSLLSKNRAEVKRNRAALGTYKNMSDVAKRNKAAMVKEINNNIAKSVKEGLTISQSLAKAIQNLSASNSEKELIKQQVLQQVAQEVPLHFATQQAIQNVIQIPVADAMQEPLDVANTTLTGKKTVEDILASL